MKLQAIEIRKRNVTRTLYVPTPKDAYAWRKYDIRDKRFVFYVDRTEYKRGNLRIVFDLEGRAIEGYSYWTCIMCYSEPCADFPRGRLIFNDSGYGSFTGKHINEMMWFFYSGETVKRTHRVYSRVQKTVGMNRYTNYDGVPQVWPITRSTSAYTSEDVTEVVDSGWYYKADQICWGRGVTADEMRQEYKTMQHHRPWAVLHEERMALRAREDAHFAFMQANGWQGPCDVERCQSCAHYAVEDVEVAS